LGIALPAFLTVLATVAVVFLALTRMSGEVDDIDAGTLRRTVAGAYHTLARRVVEAHLHVADSPGDLAALGVSARGVDARAAAATAEPGALVDTVFVLAADGATLGGVHAGAPVAAAAADWFQGGLDVVLGRVRGDPGGAPKSGLFSTPDGIVVAAVAPLPGSDRLLVTGRNLTADSVEALGRDFSVDGLTLSGDPGGGVDIDLLSPDGNRIASLVADPRRPGQIAYERVRTPMLVVLGLLLLVMVFLVATIWKSLSAMHRGEELARREAGLDGLSGLPNRASFHQSVEAAVASAGGRPVTIVFLDLDGFKDVNDTYGHETGDRLIRAVAAGFSALVGERGFLARLGGDEFAVVATGEASFEVAVEIGAEMIEFLSEPFDLDGRIVQVGTSVGVAGTAGERITASELVRRADVAMYQAKGRGKNRIEIYEHDMDAERAERAALAVALRKAFSNEELQLHYQPVIDARSGRIVSVEALLRWIRPVEGPVSPARFIPIAEEIGLIEDLGAWVLRRACRDAAAFGDLRVAVNVSAAQFKNPGFHTVVAGVLAEEGFPAARLELDITESYLVAYPDRARRMIDALREIGVRIALDDFGTGFSSIGYLRRFAFDKVKIDRSVIIDVVRDPASQKLVEATVALADALGVGVTAEGIEREDEAVILKSAGCHELQGYHFGSPTTAAEITRRMAASRQALRRTA